MLISQEFSWNDAIGFETLEGSAMFHYDKVSNIFYGVDE
jgi:hypothetical protein